MRADKRARIEQAMAALDYIPNRTAQVLKGSRSRLIGVLLPDLTNPIYSEIASRGSSIPRPLPAPAAPTIVLYSPRWEALADR